MDLLIREFPDARRTLAARRLPQPDQLCGPFAAAAALAAVMDDAPGVLELAALSGTMIWPHDVRESRPPGTALDRTGWAGLPEAPDVAAAGTTAVGLSSGIEAASGGRIAVVPAAGPSVPALLDDLLNDGVRVAVVANVRTGPIVENTWDVGHFVALWGVADDGRIAVADSYRQLGDRGLPAGCRLVSADSFVEALTAPPGRGVLLLTPDHERVSALSRSAGTDSGIWST